MSRGSNCSVTISFDGPIMTAQTSRGRRRLSTRHDSLLREHEVVYELRAQLWTNAGTQPIEDTSVEWPTPESQYRTVATLRLPAQDVYSPARQRYFDEEMTFRPAHSLLAHQLLGSVMRARLQVYKALAAFRQRQNGVAAARQRDIAEVPV